MIHEITVHICAETREIAEQRVRDAIAAQQREVLARAVDPDRTLEIPAETVQMLKALSLIMRAP